MSAISQNYLDIIKSALSNERKLLHQMSNLVLVDADNESQPHANYKGLSYEARATLRKDDNYLCKCYYRLYYFTKEHSQSLELPTAGQPIRDLCSVLNRLLHNEIAIETDKNRYVSSRVQAICHSTNTLLNIAAFSIKIDDYVPGTK